jgi:hypothetical protein
MSIDWVASLLYIFFALVTIFLFIFDLELRFNSALSDLSALSALSDLLFSTIDLYRIIFLKKSS